MAINPNIGSTNFQGTSAASLRESRRADVESKIQEATLSPNSQLSSQEVREHQGFYNQSVENIDKLRGSEGGALSGIDHARMCRCFPGLSDVDKVRNATAPSIFDNKEAKQLKKEYRDAFQEARRERASAERQARKLGPGTHKLSNGDTVTVKIDKASGQTTVSTKGKDGSSKTVSFNKKDPNSVVVTKTNADGTKTKLSQRGTRVAKSTTDQCGKKVTNEYSIDDKGRPVRETWGRGVGDAKPPFPPIGGIGGGIGIGIGVGGGIGIGGGQLPLPGAPHPGPVAPYDPSAPVQPGGPFEPSGPIRPSDEMPGDLGHIPLPGDLEEAEDLENECGGGAESGELPDDEDYTKTVVNEDGSTDESNLIYIDENGKPVFKETHKEPGLKLQPIKPPCPWWRLDDVRVSSLSPAARG